MGRIIAFFFAVLVAYIAFMQISKSLEKQQHVDKALDNLASEVMRFCRCRGRDSLCIEKSARRISEMRPVFAALDAKGFHPTERQQERAKMLMAYVKRCSQKRQP